MAKVKAEFITTWISTPKLQSCQILNWKQQSSVSCLKALGTSPCTQNLEGNFEGMTAPPEKMRHPVSIQFYMSPKTDSHGRSSSVKRSRCQAHHVTRSVFPKYCSSTNNQNKMSRFPGLLVIMQERFLWEINVSFCQVKAEKHLSVTEYALYYFMFSV